MLPALPSYPCGAAELHRSFYDVFSLTVFSSGGTVISAGNASGCIADHWVAEDFFKLNNQDTVAFPGTGTITVSIKGSKVTFSAHGVSKTVTIKGHLFGVFAGDLVAQADSGPFDPAKFTKVSITAGGRTAGLRAWWLKTTLMKWRGLETHVSPGGLRNSHHDFTLTRYFDG